MRNIALTLEYCGTNYAGWQVQMNQQTIQGALGDAIYKVTAQQVTIHGAGRTDAGVHALGQVASFRIDHGLSVERMADALNFHLPDDIRVKSAHEVPDDFHARFSAVWRRYRYLVASERSALYRDRRWEVECTPDDRLLKSSASLLVGEHDFSPFCVAASRPENCVCRVETAHWRTIGPLRVFEIRANRFLHSMVRSLVGGMINLACPQDSNPHNLTLDSFADIIRLRARDRVVFTAPPHGLYLVAVRYPKEYGIP